MRRMNDTYIQVTEFEFSFPIEIQAGANQLYFLNKEDLILKVKKASAENAQREKKKKGKNQGCCYEIALES